MEKTLVFVYGTLRKGFWNHRLIEDAEFVGEAYTVDKYCMTVSGIPYVHTGPAVAHIKGEVYAVDDMTLMRLDVLEGHPTWYERKLVSVKFENGKIIKAWLYFNDRSKGEIIAESGDFTDYVRKAG